jgi:hypothetical protein
MDEKTNKYYVYIHINSKTDLPFYIGLGQKYRISSKSGRNKKWIEIASNDGYYYGYLKENLSFEDANKYEKEYIKLFKDIGFDLANLNMGGSGNLGIKLPKRTIEHCKKLGDSQRGKKRKPHTDEIKKLLSEKLKGKKKPPRTQEHKEKLKNWKPGNTPWNKNKNHKKETIEKIKTNNGMSKKILVLSVDGIKMYEFNSIKETSEFLSINYNYIYRFLNGERKKSKIEYRNNFIFKYKKK